ncbi:MAG: transporter substrate-binding protein [Paenibacillaceae bacterium]|jgi:putative hydroxymethylpyrimidine transport system substrate-binding protein|nr:transporter substrate-binding protein [Paenibacillaceae bacterium]
MILFGKKMAAFGKLLALALAAALAVTGCGKAADPAGGAGQEQELTVLLDWYPNAVHSFLFAAEKEGYFKEAGLKVKLETPAGTDDAVKLLAAGKADLALSYQTVIAISRAEDIPVVSLAAIVRHPLNQLFALDSAGVKRPKDLEGKSIGYPSIPLDEAIVNTMVKADGGDPSKVKYTDIGWDLIPAMTTKKVDAIIGGYINHEKLLLEKEGIKMATLDPVKYGVPDFYELVLAASEDGLKKNREVYKKFWAAATKGYEYTVKNPEASLKNLLDQQNKDFPLDPEVEKQSLNILLPLMDAGKDPFGAQTEASWQSIIDWLKNAEQLKKAPVAKDSFTNLQ